MKYWLTEQAFEETSQSEQTVALALDFQVEQPVSSALDFLILSSLGNLGWLVIDRCRMSNAHHLDYG